MKKLVIVLAAVLLASTACSDPQETAPTDPPLNLSSNDLREAVIGDGDLGDEWDQEDDARPSTVQVGGKVGPANIEPVRASATSAFVQKEGSGYLSNTLYLLQDEAAAQAVMDAHIEHDDTRTWKQDRDDGGEANYERQGRVPRVSNLGDELYTSRIKATINTPNDESVERTIDYIAFRLRSLVAFVVVQDIDGGTFARRLEPKVTRLVE
jgi:hypothetical protein